MACSTGSELGNAGRTGAGTSGGAIGTTAGGATGGAGAGAAGAGRSWRTSVVRNTNTLPATMRLATTASTATAQNEIARRPAMPGLNVLERVPTGCVATGSRRLA